MQSSQMAGWTTLLGRVALAAIFIIIGWGKIMGFAGTVGYIASVGLPMPEVLAVLAIIFEFGGGVLLLLGWQTRWAAKALAVFVIAATAAFHTNLADQMQMIMFLKNVSIVGGLLFVMAYGAGAYSLDEKMAKKAA